MSISRFVDGQECAVVEMLKEGESVESRNTLDLLREFVPDDKEVAIVCIGTDRSTGDAYGPLVGTRLKALGAPCPVYGTLDEPVHAVNLSQTVELVEKAHPEHFVIAVDSCLGKSEHIGNIYTYNRPCRPGAGVHKDLKEVGNVSVMAVVNVSGFMEYFVLQNTRLSRVMKLADERADQLVEFLATRSLVREVAVAE